MNTKIYVGNLPYNIDSNKLKDMFSEFGEVVESSVISDRFSGRSKGFGFVTFADEKSAKEAIEKMNQKEYEGRKLNVNEARAKEE